MVFSILSSTYCRHFFHLPIKFAPNNIQHTTREILQTIFSPPYQICPRGYSGYYRGNIADIFSTSLSNLAQIIISVLHRKLEILQTLFSISLLNLFGKIPSLLLDQNQESRKISLTIYWSQNLFRKSVINILYSFISLIFWYCMYWPAGREASGSAWPLHQCYVRSS